MQADGTVQRTDVGTSSYYSTREGDRGVSGSLVTDGFGVQIVLCCPLFTEKESCPLQNTPTLLSHAQRYKTM